MTGEKGFDETCQTDLAAVGDDLDELGDRSALGFVLDDLVFLQDAG